MKKCLSFLLALATIISIFSSTLIPASAAAKNPWDYSSTPTRAIYYKSPVMTGNDVKWVQQSLNIVNSAKLTVDGSAGPATKKAILAYQKKYKLQQDGSFGPASRSKMVSLLNSKGYYPKKGSIKVYKGITSIGSDIYISSSGGSTSLLVKSSSSWSVSSNTSWISVGKKVTGDMRLYCKRTYGKNKRSGKITIKNNEGTVKTITVTQYGVYYPSEHSGHKHSCKSILLLSFTDTADIVFTSVLYCKTCGTYFPETANSWSPPIDEDMIK